MEELFPGFSELCEEFSWISPDAADDQWYPGWNTILMAAFPYTGTEKYMVAFKYNAIRLPSSVIDETAFFVVQKDKRPVFFVEVRPQKELQSASKRGHADSHVRDKFADLLNESNVPVLHGICAFGSIYAPYTLNRQTTRITPSRAVVDPEFLEDPAPVERWAHEMQSKEGQEHFTSLVKQVKEIVNSISAETAPAHGHEEHTVSTQVHSQTPSSPNI